MGEAFIPSLALIWFIGSLLASISVHSGNLVSLSLVGRDECHARLVQRNTDSMKYLAATWRSQRTVQYKDVQLAGDSEGWGPLVSLVRNQVLVPMFGNKAFEEGNRDRTLSSTSMDLFPFSALELQPVPNNAEYLLVKMTAIRELKGDDPSLPKAKTRVDWQGYGKFEVGDWSDVQNQRPFKIVFRPEVCRAYEMTFGAPTQEVPGIGLTQFCAWLKTRPELPASKTVNLSTTIELAFIEGSGNALRFVSPSATAELLLQN